MEWNPIKSCSSVKIMQFSSFLKWYLNIYIYIMLCFIIRVINFGALKQSWRMPPSPSPPPPRWNKNVIFEVSSHDGTLFLRISPHKLRHPIFIKNEHPPHLNGAPLVMLICLSISLFFALFSFFLSFPLFSLLSLFLLSWFPFSDPRRPGPQSAPRFDPVMQRSHFLHKNYDSPTRPSLSHKTLQVYPQ